MVKKPFEKSLSILDVESLIEKCNIYKQGEAETVKEEWTNINIRIPKNMINSIDRNVKNRIGMTRTGWILEALSETLKKLDTQ